MNTSHSEQPAMQSMDGPLEPSTQDPLTRLLLRYAAWIRDRNVPFLIMSIGMIVMLLWAGAYKMTVPGANGIVPLVTNSPLISWQFRLFGTYLGADLIGSTEWTAAILILLGYRWPRLGILGGVLTTAMFFVTSSFLITTPATTISVNGMRFLDDLGLFLYKDIISLGVSCYLVVHFSKRVS